MQLRVTFLRINSHNREAIKESDRRTESTNFSKLFSFALKNNYNFTRVVHSRLGVASHIIVSRIFLVHCAMHLRAIDDGTAAKQEITSFHHCRTNPSGVLVNVAEVAQHASCMRRPRVCACMCAHEIERNGEFEDSMMCDRRQLNGMKK